MIGLSDGYVYSVSQIKALEREFMGREPNKFQKFIWMLWPTIKSVRYGRWNFYKKEIENATL